MTKRRFVLYVVAASAAWLLAALPLSAQSQCEIKLREADMSYQSGQLDAVLTLTNDCLSGTPSREEKKNAFALAVKAHLAKDDLATSRRLVEELLRVAPDYQPDQLRDPARFIRLVDEVRAASATVVVTSVSKSPESLRQAPGTVVVITAAEIERRGYRDLEEVFHDLPGFEIARSNGVTYSTLYQRGYRSDLTQRTILLIDGVEENDLWVQVAWISRQYPLSNVDRIEVVYGPASTMYGANAFAGVVNVITKTAEQIVEKGKRFGLTSTVGSGSWDTRMADVTMAGRSANDNISWTLTARGYQSDEYDLSKYPEWDYDMARYAWDYDNTRRGSYAGRLNQTGVNSTTGLYNAQAFLDANPGMPLDSPYYTILRNTEGIATDILLTEAGSQRAFDLDLLGYNSLGGPQSFSDPTDDWAVQAKLRVYGLSVGFQTWRQEEGWTPSHQDMFAPGSAGTFTWTPRQTWLYAKYSRELSDSLSYSFFARYKTEELDEPTIGHTFLGYGSTVNAGYSMADLAAGRTSVWSRTYFSSESSQLRAENSLTYTPSEKLDVVGGFEARFSDIQGTYVWGSSPNPAETGAPRWSIPGGNRFHVRDLGLYAQASYKPWKNWKFVIGGRGDDNRVRTTGGYGTVFNPRLGAIYSPGDFTFKAIYSEAFQEVSNFQKYVLPNNVGAADLEPEKVKNTELSAAWQPTKQLSLDLTAYDATYSDVVQLVTQGSTRSFQQIGAMEIQGLQATATYKVGDLTLFGNYTYMHPYLTDPRIDVTGHELEADELRITDIADHHVNLGVDLELWDRLKIDLRGNYVSKRDQGPETTALLFGGTFNYPMIDAYTVAHLAVTYETPIPLVKLQGVVNNLFDEEYFDPGPRDKDPIYTGRSPQPGRSVMLRAIVTY